MASFLDLSPVDALLDRANFVPSNIARQNLVSGTNAAYTCFTQQKFSSDLQVFLINYVISISSYQSVYK